MKSLLKILFDDFRDEAYNAFAFNKKGRVQMDREKLFQDKEVLEEINRHKWLRSEMVGYDIGFDVAAKDWFENYASAWIAHHCKGKCKK